ncbi:sulfite exporter TauE/SafE family protein [Candidatus Methanodesulfokora washburnensis]|uniref:Probable membrane transporter protein n=2 Tax=Candidatus Methanodesulfokora washburnensis TaxID=2478471 RepID=A0A520KQ34_9CREN|nr:sulfite exporter TauE/SafE family protein [Candidatus Methanodesulfokores washburnensis]RZN63525.1 MAG: sulfite exporter TauE/SafE family protein [Candidatus Methanodesulfokores washburnensis]
MDPFTSLLMLIVGIIAGFFGALLGIGGGVIIIPCLTMFFNFGIKEAIAVSIVSVVATSIAGASRYVEQRITNVRLGMFLETATTAGAVSGAFLAVKAPSSFLYILMGILLIYLSVSQLLTRKKEEEKLRNDLFITKEDEISRKLGLSNKYPDIAEGKEVNYTVIRTKSGLIASYLAGLISAMLGIGGGIIKVPVMNQLMNVPMKAAVATSKFMIGVTASTGALLYLAYGLVNTEAVAPVAMGVMIGATAGTSVMNKMKAGFIKLIFGLILLYFAYNMIIKGV